MGERLVFRSSLGLVPPRNKLDDCEIGETLSVSKGWILWDGVGSSQLDQRRYELCRHQLESSLEATENTARHASTISGERLETSKHPH